MINKVKTYSLVLAGILLISSSAMALTLDQAKARIRTQAQEQKMTRAEHSDAAATLRWLVNQGVPVEQAYRLVEASMTHGIRGPELARIAATIETQAMNNRGDAAGLAEKAIRNRYTFRETERIMNTFQKAVKDGVPATDCARIMTRAVERNIQTGELVRVTEQYAAEVNRAADNAARNMEQARTRTREQMMDKTGDRDRDRDHDRDRDRDRTQDQDRDRTREHQ